MTNEEMYGYCKNFVNIFEDHKYYV